MCTITQCAKISQSGHPGPVISATKITIIGWVTRLGEFLPIGWLFTFDSFFLQIAVIVHILGQFFQS
jgi:hypothetical protein